MSHPEIIIEKKSDSPDEDKRLADAKALIPTLMDFFKNHPLINPKTFLGDATFDSVEIYKYLLQETSFEKACIPLKNKLKMKWEWNNTTKKSKRVCHCDNPCTTSSCGRMIYIYPEKNLRAYPGCVRGTEEWAFTYKIRVNVEKAINHFKDSFCVAGR